MSKFLVNRILSLGITLWLIASLTFFLVRLAPGGPFDTERAWPPEVQKNIEMRYGLDRPLIDQYFSWSRDVLRGDFRDSFQYIGRPVSEIISETLPYSFLLGSLSLIFAIGFGLPLGALSAWKPRSFFDTSAAFIAIAGVSLPAYLVAALLVLIFSNVLGWLPPALSEGPASYVLPTITLGLKPLSLIARLTRSQLLEVLHSDFIRTAHAKGAHPSSVVLKHALLASAGPLLAVLGPIAANVLTGSFLVETVFQIPGLGKYFVTAVINRDYPLVSGVTLIYAIILLSANLFVDLISAWIDPRIQIERQG